MEVSRNRIGVSIVLGWAAGREKGGGGPGDRANGNLDNMGT